MAVDLGKRPAGVHKGMKKGTLVARGASSVARSLRSLGEDSTSPTRRLRRVGPLSCGRRELGWEGGETRAMEVRGNQPEAAAGGGQAHGRGGARSPYRAHTRARTLYKHTPGARPRRGAGRRAEASVLK